MNKQDLGIVLEIFGLIGMISIIFSFELTVVNNVTIIYYLFGIMFWFGIGLYLGSN